MNQPTMANASKVDLADLTARTDFVTKILEREAGVSNKEFGTADYSDVIGKLGEAFAVIIGNRRGPYRDYTEQSDVSQRLSDVGWGFLAGVGREKPNNRMLQAWITPVIEAINNNFTQRT